MLVSHSHQHNRVPRPIFPYPPGKNGAQEKWRFWYYDWEGKRLYRTGTTSETQTLAIATKLEEEHRQIRLGYLPRPKKKRSAESMTELIEEYLEHGRLMGGRGGRPCSATPSSRTRATI